MWELAIRQNLPVDCTNGEDIGFRSKYKKYGKPEML